MEAHHRLLSASNTIRSPRADQRISWGVSSRRQLVDLIKDVRVDQNKLDNSSRRWQRTSKARIGNGRRNLHHPGNLDCRYSICNRPSTTPINLTPPNLISQGCTPTRALLADVEVPSRFPVHGKLLAVVALLVTDGCPQGPVV